MMILGIESSCDESALALFDPQQGMIGEWVASQISVHQTYGGVVPDLASREHLLNFFPLLKHALPYQDLVQKIAVTHGPGLPGCLAMGIALSKSLALAWQVPLVGINHLHGHAVSPFIGLHHQKPSRFWEAWGPLLPHLGLLVSGGNTLLFEIASDHSLKVLGETLDDAAGEALDKGAKLLGMPYPGGPWIEQCAQKGDPHAIAFPHALQHTNELKFSFSGLKTSLRYKLEALDDIALEACRADLCASYQEAIVDQLVTKTQQALAKGSFNSLGLSGGVAQNQRLREAFTQLSHDTDLLLWIATQQHSGDNAEMIAFAAWIHSVIQPEQTPPSEYFAYSFAPALSF